MCEDECSGLKMATLMLHPLDGEGCFSNGGSTFICPAETQPLKQHIHKHTHTYMHIYTHTMLYVCMYMHMIEEGVYICIHTYTNICIYMSCPIMCCVWCTENQEVEGAGYWLTLQRTQDMTSLNFHLLLGNRENGGIFSLPASHSVFPPSLWIHGHIQHQWLPRQNTSLVFCESLK